MLKLKKIQILGFKSFCDRTELTLPGQGMAAVVGPNGCGKSNILDAVSWVLGEQSARTLRGTKMEDVIFAGTRDRKALGMAEVSLTLIDPDAYGEGPLATELQPNEVALDSDGDGIVAANGDWDEDAHHDSPEEFADENDLKVGAEFELQAATYWKEKFRVTKVPDDVSDDYECETLSQQREEFQTYQEMEARLAKIEAELQAARAAAPQNDTEEVATQIWRLTTGAEPSDTPQDDIDRGEIEAIAKLLRPLRAAAPQASPR